MTDNFSEKYKKVLEDARNKNIQINGQCIALESDYKLLDKIDNVQEAFLWETIDKLYICYKEKKINQKCRWINYSDL